MLSNLTEELKRIAHNKLTGLIFITSGANRSAQISFLDGNIVFALSQGKKGQSAIEMIAQMDQLRFRFQEGAIPASRAEMPSFKEIQECLQKGGKEKQPSSGKLSERASTNTFIKEKEVSRSVSFSAEQKQLIQEVLSEYIGPMAIILCEDHLEDVDTMEEAIARISREIPAQQEARFREELLRRMLK